MRAWPYPGTPPGEPEAACGLYLIDLLPTQALVTIAAIGIVREIPDYWESVGTEDREILKLLAQDASLKEVSQKLFLSESAIDSRIRKLKTKLGVENIGGLVATAIQNFLV